MKKTISYILLVVLIFSAVPAYGQESGDAKIIFSENFGGNLNRWHLNYGIIGLYYDKVDSYIGQYINLNSSDSMESVPFGVEEGKVYTLAIDIKGKDRNNLTILSFFAEDGKKIASDEYQLKNNSGLEIWHTGFVTVTAPKGSAFAKIEIKGSLSGAACCFDNVVFCEGEVFYSGDFERRKKESPLAVDNSDTVYSELKPVFFEDFEDEKIDGWIYYDKKSESKVKIEEGSASTGGFSLMLKDDLTSGMVGITTPYFDIEEEAEYKLSIDMSKQSGPDKPASGKLVFYSSGNSVLESFSFFGETVSWNTCSVMCTAPKGAVKANIILESGDKTGISFVDNIMMIKTKDKPEPDKMAELNKSSIVLFLGSAKALVNGERILIDKTNENVKANSVNGRTLVPVRFIAENFGAEVGWDDATRTVTLTLKNKVVKIVLDKAEIDIDGSITPIDVPAQSIEGRTMLPLRAFVETVMGKKIFWDSRGLIVITDTEMLTIEKDSKIIDKLIEYVK